MKIYLASTAPGNEGGGYMITTPNRLLSYYHVLKKEFYVDEVFDLIIEKKGRINGNS